MDQFGVLIFFGICLTFMIRVMVNIESKDKVHVIFTYILGFITILYLMFVYSYLKYSP